MYSPILGRWTEADPAGYAGGLNMWETELSNTPSLVDPVGLTPYPHTFPPAPAAPLQQTYQSPGGTFTITINPNSSTVTKSRAGTSKAFDLITKDGFGYNFSPNSVTANIDFTPAPGSCECDSVAFIQLVRQTHSTTGANSIPDKDFVGRMLPNYFTLDADPRQTDPYAGRLPGGKYLPNTSYGPNRAMFQDKPGNPVRGGRNQKWEFKVYAVCEAGKDKGRVLAALSWGFSTDNRGQIIGMNSQLLPGRDPDFDQALSAWNRQASSASPAVPGQKPVDF